MMSIFKKSSPNSEKDLHFLIENNLAMIEEGMTLLKREYKFSDGIPDFLCVDSGGSLVIIEVKKSSEDRAIFQALRYYGTINQNIHSFKTVFPEISLDYYPRIILIAETFSDSIKKICNLVEPEVQLFEYMVLIDSKDERGIVFHPVDIPETREEIRKPWTYENHRNYLTNDALKPLFEKLREEVKKVGTGIEEYSTSAYIGYKYNGRVFAAVKTQRKSVDLEAVVIDKNGSKINHKKIRLDNKDENYSLILSEIKKSYNNLKQLLK